MIALFATVDLKIALVMFGISLALIFGGFGWGLWDHYKAKRRRDV